MTAVQTYKNLFVRSMQYVDRVKSKDHPDVNNFKSLICSMMDKASEGIKGTDRLIGQCIARDSDDDVANVQQTMLRDIGLPRGGLEGGGRCVLRKSWFKTKLRQSARWLGWASPCRRLSSRPPTLPCRWTSSLFGLSICAQDSCLKSDAETGFRDNFNDHVKKFFSDDCKVVPSDHEVLEMLRWAQSSSTPNFASSCVKSSQAITFFTKHNEGIGAACKKRETDNILCTTKKYSAILAEQTKEALVQIFDAIFKHQPGTSEGIRAKCYSAVDKKTRWARRTGEAKDGGLRSWARRGRGCGRGSGSGRFIQRRCNGGRIIWLFSVGDFERRRRGSFSRRRMESRVEGSLDGWATTCCASRRERGRQSLRRREGARKRDVSVEEPCIPDHDRVNLGP